MAEASLFQPRRFRTAAQHYLAGRPAYAPRLIQHVAGLVGLLGTDRVLDLGCGPGMLAGAFAPLAGEVVAMDPEPEMLRIAEAEFGERGRIRFVNGSSFDLSAELGRFRLVTMGRSFHWMERAATLRRLHTMIEPEGAVVCFDGTHCDLPENAWYGEYRRVVARYAANDIGHVRRASGTWVRHEAFLLDSSFSQVDELSAIERRAVTLEQLIDRALSRSSTAPDRLGDRVTTLAREIEALPLPRTGLTEVVATTALIGRRP